jgi:tetratricopeptide (TPR) repeat protein
VRDIFALQDEVTREIVAALAVQLGEGEETKLTRKYKPNPEAYDYVLRGGEYFHRLTKESNLQARRMFEKALELDPEYALAYASEGWTFFMEWSFGWSQTPESLERAFELAQKAVALNDAEPESYCLLGNVYLWKKEHEQAIAVFKRSIELNPNYADALAALGNALTWAGSPEEAIGLIKRAMRLDPRHPVQHLFYLGHAYFLAQRYDDAVAVLKRVLIRNPNFHPAHVFLAASYVELGRNEEAQAEVEELMTKKSQTPLEEWGKKLPYKDQTVLQRLFDDLRKAGLK